MNWKEKYRLATQGQNEQAYRELRERLERLLDEEGIYGYAGPIINAYRTGKLDELLADEGIVGYTGKIKSLLDSYQRQTRPGFENPRRNGMRVVRDEIPLCQDCMIAAVNDDYTSLDYYYGEEADSRRAEIEKGLNALGPHLVPSFDSETGKGMDEFSRRRCESCRTDLAGARYDFAILGETGVKKRAKKKNPDARVVFVKDDFGCYADGANGHNYVRRRIADLLEDAYREKWSGTEKGIRWSSSAKEIGEVWKSLRGEMPDDAWDENEAIELLNARCEEGIHFDFHDGDFCLIRDGDLEENPKSFEDEIHTRLNYGEVPPLAEFKRATKGYYPFFMTLRGEDARVGGEVDYDNGTELDAAETHRLLKRLVKMFERGDEAAGDLASGIMTTLGYEWV